MKIGIDTFGCDHARSGLGSYLLHFASNLPKDSDIEIELFGQEIDKFTYTSGKDIPFKAVDVADKLSSERLWHFKGAKKFFKEQKYDAVLFPAPENVLPVSFKTKGIACVNTALSGLFEKNNDIIQKTQIKKGLKKVQKIIAASHFIADDLISLGVDKNKIKVVYNGIDHEIFFPMIDTDDDVVNVKPFAIRKPYFIYGSRLSSAKKKHIELIKAFSLFKEKTKLPHRLVLAGSDGEYSKEIHTEAFSSPYASDIFLTGFFPHANFAQLYAGAEACIFPSVEEGVGLPILEAMAIGIPVSCSNKGVLPEVAKDAAFYFDANNIEEIANSMEKIISDEKLRSDLVQKGLQRAKLFNWEKTISETFEVIRKMM